MARAQREHLVLHLGHDDVGSIASASLKEPPPNDPSQSRPPKRKSHPYPKLEGKEGGVSYRRLM